ncbi:MAG: beta-lactamase family protein [Chitinophagales bacterium]|nr:beta-lactamase family protein [Chitinophagales bacterium]
MTKSRFVFFFLSIVLIPDAVISQNLETQIDKLYQVTENSPGFSIAIFKNNEIILEKQYGNAHLDYNVPITKETVFDIGSIGKQFTAAAILLLEHQGKLSIKDPAYKYIENLPQYKKGNPTIEHLLNQTSGIKEVDNYLEVGDIHFRDYIRPTMLINIITNINELYFKPGEYFYYTNANYILLASIIEKASGLSYDDYLKQNIFEPLKMENTVVNTDVFRTIKNRAIGYQEYEGQFYKTHQYGLFYTGDGQIITNPNDMFKWHQNLKNATIGTPELWQKMHTKAKLNNGTVINSGLGVEFETHNGYEAMGFDGMIISGFVSKYLYFPELDLAFFTTQNTFDWDFKDRFFELIDLYVSSKEVINESINNKAIQVSGDELKKYEGYYLFYKHDEDRKVNKIELKDDVLQVLTLDGDKIAALIPISNHQFLFGEDGNAIVKFNFDGKQKQYIYDDLENKQPWLFKEFHPYKHSRIELKEYEGQYFNKELQISKKLKLEDGTLYYYHRNGAWKDEVESLSKDVLEIPISPIEFIRDGDDEIIGFELMGLLFKKM